MGLLDASVAVAVGAGVNGVALAGADEVPGPELGVSTGEGTLAAGVLVAPKRFLLAPGVLSFPFFVSVVAAPPKLNPPAGAAAAFLSSLEAAVAGAPPPKLNPAGAEPSVLPSSFLASGAEHNMIRFIVYKSTNNNLVLC